MLKIRVETKHNVEATGGINRSRIAIRCSALLCGALYLGVAHFSTGFLAALGCNRSRSVFDDDDVKTLLPCIKRGREYTHVLGETPDPQAFNALVTELYGKPRLIEG
jgi:hypothetical protein